ncbi:MAG: sugar ABC transporter permease [Bacilli bacterium]|nr:sugar ABC transporter permease [Bacilli bacterium]
MRAKRNRLSKKVKNNLIGYCLILPMVVGFVIFTLIPLIKTIQGSFYDMTEGYWDTSPEYFIGTQNFKVLFEDQKFIKSITNTLFLMLGIPIGMLFAFLLATLINSKFVKAKKPYLILYYLPAVTSAVAIGVVWKWLFNGQYGAINIIFHTNVHWLSDPSVVKITLIMKGVWGGLGGTLLLYYASIQNISLDMYEAADIAGANTIQKMFHITIPLVNGTSFYLLVTGIIGGIMAFADNYVIVASSESQTIVYYLYDCFKRGEYGLVAAGAIFVFGLLFVVTLLQFYLNSRGKKAVR